MIEAKAALQCSASQNNLPEIREEAGAGHTNLETHRAHPTNRRHLGIAPCPSTAREVVCIFRCVFSPHMVLQDEQS